VILNNYFAMHQIIVAAADNPPGLTNDNSHRLLMNCAASGSRCGLPNQQDSLHNSIFYHQHQVPSYLPSIWYSLLYPGPGKLFKQKRILVKPEAKLVKSTHVIACEGIQNYQYEILFKEHHMLVPKDDLVQTIKYASVTMQCI